MRIFYLITGSIFTGISLLALGVLVYARWFGTGRSEPGLWVVISFLLLIGILLLRAVDHAVDHVKVTESNDSPRLGWRSWFPILYEFAAGFIIFGVKLLNIPTGLFSFHMSIGEWISVGVGIVCPLGIGILLMVRGVLRYRMAKQR